MKLVGANPNPRIEALEELPGKVNYFIGNDPEKWRTNIPIYAKVRYQDAYPGVDLVYYGNQHQLEYDFVIAPDADPKAIKLAFEGADKLEIDSQGDLILHTEGGEVRLLKLHIYQEVNDTKQPISGSYVLLEPSTLDSRPLTQKVGFQVAAYDASKPLVIDPVMLIYSTYLGGGSTDIAVDAFGNAYVTGNTGSTDFPTTTGAFQTAYGGGGDAFVTKLNTDGSALVYSTYLGGTGYEYGHGITLDSAGNAYVTGETRSLGFPTTPGAFQNTLSFPCPAPWKSCYPSSGDVFITKLNPEGSALVYSTYLGGTSYDYGYGIALDTSGNAYVTGYTWSSDFPTASPLQTGDVAPAAFVTKLNPEGSALVYSTYLGGTGDDRGFDIAVDTSGNAYVTGFTDAADFPVTPGTFQTAGGNTFIAKIADTDVLFADLTLAKTDSPDPIIAGDNLTYTITVINNGPDAATGVVVTDTLPSGMTLSLSSASQGTCSGTSAITCNLGTINNGASATVTIVVIPTAAGEISNTATVTGNEADFNSANNTATAVTTVNPAADLSVIKTDSPDPVTVGSILTYTITVINGGPNTATGVTVQDTLPTGVTYVSATPSQGSCLLSGGVVTCTLETLATGASATVTIVVTPATAGEISNTADVTGNEADPVLDNNTATAVTIVAQQICPATAALEGDPQKATKLEILYDFRDEVLASTPTGQRYIELFYKHAEEGVWLMFLHPELLSHTRTLLERFLPTIQLIIDGQPVTLTTTDVADIEDLLDAIAARASPQLQETIQQLRSNLHSEELLSLFGIDAESSR